uniref:t-SNARE domain containing 1 n=1 Tax=Leptobrachium leishanense TaxID=445787 RepID=A0A8C5Q8I7_9ANUR
MSYGSVDGSGFGSRNPFGGPSSQGYQPLATQVDPSELHELFQLTTGDVFRINSNVQSLERILRSLGTPSDSQELRDQLHFTQQETNNVILSCTKSVRQLSEAVRGSSRKIADKSKILLAGGQKNLKLSPGTQYSDTGDDEKVFNGDDELWQNQSQSQDIPDVSEEDLDQIRNKEESVKQIESDMIDVNQIIKDLASIVYEQGDSIDSIEANLESASSNIDSANRQLAKASHQQRRARKMKCCLISTALFVLAVIILIISLSVK